MDFDRTHTLAFLFSLGALPVAGCGGTSSDSTGTTGTDDSTSAASNVSQTDSVTLETSVSATTNMTSADSTGITTTASTTQTTTDATTTDATTTDATTTDATTTDATTSEGSSGGSTTGGMIDPTCASLAAKYSECYPRYAMYEMQFAQYCTEMLLPYYQMISDACVMAFEEAVACISMADCADLMAETACTDELAAQSMECGGEAGTSGVVTGGSGSTT